MVKIRLRRIGAKGRPFYRVVVAESTSGRNGKFVETIGTYDPIAQPKHVQIDESRALHWLLQGAEPTETTAYLLNKQGILPKFFEQRPTQKKKYSFLDKRTAAVSVKSVVEPVAAERAAPPAENPKAAEPEAAPVAAPEAAAEPAPVATEAPAAEAEPEGEGS